MKYRIGDIVEYRFEVKDVYPETQHVSDGRAMFTFDAVSLKKRKYKAGDRIVSGDQKGVILAVHFPSELAWVEFDRKKLSDRVFPSVVHFANLDVE